MVKVKICGIQTLEDVSIINTYKPDYAGFVFAKSRRQISVETALMLAKNMDSEIQKTGVFVNQPVEFLTDLILQKIVDCIQLHGDEDETYEMELFNRLKEKGIHSPEDRIIKAFRIQTEEDIKKMKMTRCSRILFDAFSSNAYGGVGETFDWNMIKDMEKPFFLAGGIYCCNVTKAIREVHPYGIDLSSSLETDGRKDKEKVKVFMERIR